MPIKNRMMQSPTALLTRPVMAVGIALHMRMIPIGMRGPYLSQNGPSKNRITIVPVTAAIDDDQICSVDRPKESCTSESSGEMENLCVCVGTHEVANRKEGYNDAIE